MISRSFFFFFFLSWILTFCCCPFVKRFANKLGAIDYPGGRHIHREPTPRLGGLALAIGIIPSLLLQQHFFLWDSTRLSALLLGGVPILLLGLWDDTKGLSPSIKLIVQGGTALLCILHGLRFPGPDLLAIPATLLWLILLPNAFNLIDGLDGLCAECGGSTAIFLALLSFMEGKTAGAVAGIILSGACLGFLPHNLRQKKLFLGDTGSQLIGFQLGVLSVFLMRKETVPSLLLIVSYPLAELLSSLFRRLTQHRNPFQADRGHFHHRLQDNGLSCRQTVRVLILFSCFCGMTALLLPISIEATALMLMLFLLTALVLLDAEGLRRSRKASIQPHNKPNP